MNVRLVLRTDGAAPNVRLWVFPDTARPDERSSAYGRQAAKPGRLRVGLYGRKPSG